MASQPYTTDSVTSHDGTTIGYRQLGRGPGIILLHGGLQAAQNFMALAEALSDSFTVYIPDRRGRGVSGRPGDNHSIQNECEDVDALLSMAGAHTVFGLSSGAIIALQAARTLPAIHNVAAYEPPLFADQSHPTEWEARYEREIAQGKLAEALVTIVKGIDVFPRVLRVVPRFLVVPILRYELERDEKRQGTDDVSLKDLIPTMQYEIQMGKTADFEPESFTDMQAEVLLLGGSKSPADLRTALDRLSTVVPHATRTEFSGLDHLGPDNNGQPERVAEELCRHFV